MSNSTVAPPAASKAKRGAKKESSIPTFDWKAEKDGLKEALTWALVHGMLDVKNFKTIFGQDKGENTTKEPKITAYRRIAVDIVPEAAAVAPKDAGDRCKVKGDGLIKEYRKHVRRLRGTGEGIQDSDVSEGLNVFVVDFIGPEGPIEGLTQPEIKNLWDEITVAFPFFPTMHRRLAERPNMTPPSVTTGVGRGGRVVTVLRMDNDVIDDDDTSGIESEPSAPAHADAGSPDSTVAQQASVPHTPLRSIQASKQNPKTPAKPSSFGVDSAIEKAKSAIKQKSAAKKRGIEEILGDYMEKQTEHNRKRQRMQDDIAVRQIAVTERQQILDLFRSGLYSQEEAQERLRALDLGSQSSVPASMSPPSQASELATSPVRGSSPFADNIEQGTAMCRSYSGPLDDA